MQLILSRFLQVANCQAGILTLNNQPECYTLEPVNLMLPAGEYILGVRNEGALTNKYLLKFPDFHRGMLWIKTEKGFYYLHIGNRIKDSKGCTLVGQKMTLHPNSVEIFESKTAYENLYKKIINRILGHELEKIMIR